MGAGILPVTMYNDKIYYLLGKEVSDGKWSDFGGGKNKNETIVETAIRESYEELSGFLGSLRDMEKLIKDDLICKIKYQKYTTFVVFIEYNKNLPFYFNNHFKMIHKHFPHIIDTNGMFEKSEIRWFSIQDIISNKNYKIRDFYLNIIDELNDTHNKIERKIQNNYRKNI